MKRYLTLPLAALATASMLMAPAIGQAATPVVAYDASPPTPVTGNVASVGFEASQASELGDEITFAPGTPRKLSSIAVTMSSWACQRGAWNTNDCSTDPGAKFTLPITLTVYKQSHAGPNGTVVPGKVILKVTKDVQMFYRQSANFSKCFGSNRGKWYNASDATCYNGRAANISVNFNSVALTLPDTVVVSVAYDTTHYGYDPIGEGAACFGTDAGCPYDSLNVGTDGNAPSVGSKPNPDTVFWNTATPGQRCDNDANAVDRFDLDSPTNACWGDSIPNIKVTTF